ncbi:MAG: LPS export ABC transporter periplasmic protein LptC [Kiloniellales bacterium]
MTLAASSSSGRRAEEATRAAEAASAPPRLALPRYSGRSSYSFFVGFLKVTLPAVAVALILLIIAWPQLRFDDRAVHVSLSDLGPEQAENLSMLNPRFEGMDERNRPFNVTASEASQQTGDSSEVTLDAPRADLTLDDGSALALSAERGVYDRKAKTLNLDGEVTLLHDKGMEILTEEAEVDLEAGRARGDAPVAGQGTTGDLTAEGFVVLERGKRILFTGQSRLRIRSEEKDSQ